VFFLNKIPNLTILKNSIPEMDLHNSDAGKGEQLLTELLLKKLKLS
jgi:hypothetical protein